MIHFRREKLKKKKDKDAHQSKKDEDKQTDKDGAEDKKKDKSAKDARKLTKRTDLLFLFCFFLSRFLCHLKR